MHAKQATAVIGAILCFASSFATRPAEAQSARLPECFGAGGPGSAAAFLGSRVTLSAQCEYSLDPNRGFRTLGDSSDATLLDTLGRLGWRDGRVAVVYGRPRSDVGADNVPASSVMLAHCTDYMLQAEGSFAVRPEADARRLGIRRASGACGAATMSLHFECAADGASRDLPSGTPSLTLPACDSEWRVSARVGGRTAYGLGVVRSGRPTALLDFFARPQTGRELLVPDFALSDRGFSMRRGADADDALWAELQLAIAAGSAQFRIGTGERACQDGLPVAAAPNGDRLEFDAAPIANFMEARYGEAGRGLQPGAADWSAFLANLSVCVASSHGLHTPTMRQKPLGHVAALAQVSSATPETRFCVDEPRVEVRPRQDGDGVLDRQSRCMTTGDGAALLTVAGATIPSRPPNGLIMCRGEELVRAEAGAETITLARGLYELRVASPSACNGGLGLSAGRIAVLDPAQDWVPVGFGRVDGGETGDAAPGWRGVRIDGVDTFAFRRRDDELRFRVVAAEGASESWNDPRGGRATVLSEHAPVLGQESGDYGYAGRSALGVAISEDGACPVGENGALDRSELVTAASDLNVDQRVFAHLVVQDGQSARCVARAAIRVWPSRIVAHAVGGQRWHGRFGILGAPRLGVFLSKPEPWAIGVVLPIAHFDMHLPAGFDIEFSVPLTASIATDGRGSRVSPALMFAIDWGLPDRAPNLITLGFLLHAPWPHPDDQFYSFFLGVNLGGLYELAGSR